MLTGKRAACAAVLILALLPGQIFAAISAAMVWEVRTGGSDTANSGGFRGGSFIAAPSAPTVSHAGTGGSVAANTYYAVVTYTDGLGETVISGETAQTTTGTTSTLTTTSPGASTGALTWSSYWGTVSGGPYFPEGTGLAIGANRTRTTTPPTTGTQPRGVDRTLGNSPFMTMDNVAITGTTAGVNSNVLTFVLGYTPTGSDVGNVFHATGGTNITAGFYEITAVTTTTWTVTGAGNLTTAGGAGAAITGNMGGALASPGQVAAIPPTAGNTCYILAGTYAIGTGSVNTATNAVSLNVVMNWVGYTSNRNPLNTDTPPVMTAGANAQIVFGIQGNQAFASNLSITNPSNFTTVTAFKAIGTAFVRFRFLTSTGCATGFTAGASPSMVEDSSFTGGIAGGNGTDCVFRRVAIIDAPASTIAINLGQGGFVDECIIVNALGNGIQVANDSIVKNCVVYHPTGTGYGINIASGGPANTVIENCIVWNASGAGAVGIGSGQTNQVSVGAMVRNCAVGSSTVADYQSTLASYQKVGCLTLTADPFTNAAGNDFSLNTTAGGGALCRAAGIPGTWPGLSTTGYRDIGAVQHADPPATPRVPHPRPILYRPETQKRGWRIEDRESRKHFFDPQFPLDPRSSILDPLQRRKAA